MGVRRDIWLLTDYREAFYSTVGSRFARCSFNLDVVKAELERHGYSLNILAYANIDFRQDNFNGRLVLYQSSEDGGLHYKDFLEDMLLGIQMQGGMLIPHFHCFRAHHNKVFLEVLRDLSNDEKLQRPVAKSFGTLQDFEKWGGQYPKVIKAAWGAGSSGVRLARTPAEAVAIAGALSRTASLSEIMKEWGRRLLRLKDGYIPASLHRNKFIVQDFIPGLGNDYKVLVYWDKYYVLERKNRPGDFRASGSGLFSWPEEPLAELLDFAKRVFVHFDVPVISLDVAMAGEEPVLLECQFVCFGPYAMEHSKWFFQANGQKWIRVMGPSVPEVEYARCVASYVKAKESA